MKSPLIAIESDNREQLATTAQQLAHDLRAEGYRVEVRAFPQSAHSSAYFVNQYERSAYNQSNPYIASLFYALDRYEATNEIEQLTASGTVVICAGYIGSTLATLGAQFTDQQVRKGYYMWAYSLETGTFSIKKPDVSLVISEHIATLPELCELFPKDYILQTNTAALRSTLAPLLPINYAPVAPQAPKKAKTTPENTTVTLGAIIEELACPHAPKIEVLPAMHVEPKGLQAAQKQMFTQGMALLKGERHKILEKVNKEQRAALEFYLLPLATKATTAHVCQRSRKAKTTALQGLLTEHVPASYGNATHTIVSSCNAQPHNELSMVPRILFETAHIDMELAEKTAMTMSYDVKSRIVEAYLDDVATGQQDGDALTTAHYECTVNASPAQLIALKQLAPTLIINSQPPTARFGFTIPDEYKALEDDIEAYYDAALALYNTLSNSAAAESCVLAGHTILAAITFDAKTAQLLKGATHPLAKELYSAAAQMHPIMHSVSQ